MSGRLRNGSLRAAMREIAGALAAGSRDELHGTFQYGGAGATTWYGFANAILERESNWADTHARSRKGVRIGCPDEVAYRFGLIGRAQLRYHLGLVDRPDFTGNLCGGAGGSRYHSARQAGCLVHQLRGGFVAMNGGARTASLQGGE